jgi:hypothetical protein
VAFWAGAGIFGLGAVVCGWLLRARIPQPSAGAQPVLAHHWSLACRQPRAVVEPNPAD